MTYTERLRGDDLMHAHHRTIRNLVAALRDARKALAEAQYDAELEAMRAERATRRAREAAVDAEREREAVQWERQLQERNREQALRDLERARSYGDEYAEQRALRRLRDL